MATRQAVGILRTTLMPSGGPIPKRTARISTAGKAPRLSVQECGCGPPSTPAPASPPCSAHTSPAYSPSSSPGSRDTFPQALPFSVPHPSRSASPALSPVPDSRALTPFPLPGRPRSPAHPPPVYSQADTDPPPTGTYYIDAQSWGSFPAFHVTRRNPLPNIPPRYYRQPPGISHIPHFPLPPPLQDCQSLSYPHRPDHYDRPLTFPRTTCTRCHRTVDRFRNDCPFCAGNDPAPAVFAFFTPRCRGHSPHQKVITAARIGSNGWLEEMTIGAYSLLCRAIPPQMDPAILWLWSPLKQYLVCGCHELPSEY